DTGERAGAGERAAVDVPGLSLAEGACRGPTAADDVEGGEAAILLAGADDGKVEGAAARTAELEGIAAGTEHQAGDAVAGAEREGIAGGIARQIHGRTAGAGDHAGIEHADRA